MIQWYFRISNVHFSAEYLTIETRLSQIVPDDIGKFAVAAFQNPGKFNGREVDYVSQHLSPEEIAEALEAATGTFFVAF